jgi:hypothetical protein
LQLKNIDKWISCKTKEEVNELLNFMLSRELNIKFTGEKPDYYFGMVGSTFCLNIINQTYTSTKYIDENDLISFDEFMEVNY